MTYTEEQLFRRAVAGVILVVLLVAALVAGGWALTIALAGPSGAAQAYKQKESATNRIQKQELFVQLNADIDGYIAKIRIAKQAVAADPTSVNKTNLIGVEQICVDTVQQYNAESLKYTSRDFKSAGLPYRRSTLACT